MDPADLLEHLVRALVDSPDDVHIEAHTAEASVTFDIYVADADVGKAIGRGGVYAGCLRELFRAIYRKDNKSLNLQVVDPRR